MALFLYPTILFDLFKGIESDSIDSKLIKENINRLIRKGMNLDDIESNLNKLFSLFKTEILEMEGKENRTEILQPTSRLHYSQKEIENLCSKHSLKPLYRETLNNWGNKNFIQMYKSPKGNRFYVDSLKRYLQAKSPEYVKIFD